MLVLAFTVCSRNHTKKSVTDKYIPLKMLKQQVHGDAFNHGYCIVDDHTDIYNDSKAQNQRSQTMCHYRCVLKKI